MILTMKLLHKTIHPDLNNIGELTHFTRRCSRAIVIRDNKILLLYTERYNDFSLPGGGIDDGETNEEGLIRELKEETGAHSVTDLCAIGIYEESRPWYKDDFDVQHIISYCYFCSIGENLEETQFEDYEINNGMKVVWVDIDEAIEHNQKTIDSCSKAGMSIERELFLLKHVKSLLE